MEFVKDVGTSCCFLVVWESVRAGEWGQFPVLLQDQPNGFEDLRLLRNWFISEVTLQFCPSPPVTRYRYFEVTGNPPGMQFAHSRVHEAREATCFSIGKLLPSQPFCNCRIEKGWHSLFAGALVFWKNNVVLL